MVNAKKGIRRALAQMGYREAKPGKWLKPIAWHLFTFEESLMVWSNWFVHANGEEVLLWCDKKFEEYEEGETDTYLAQLKCFEQWTKMDISCDSSFEMPVWSWPEGY